MEVRPLRDDYESGALRIRISALIRRGQRVGLLSFCQVKMQQRMTVCKKRKRAFTEPDHADTLILDFPTPITMQNQCLLLMQNHYLLLKPYSLW